MVMTSPSYVLIVSLHICPSASLGHLMAILPPRCSALLRRRLFYKVILVQFVWGFGRPLEVILFGQTTQDALLFSLCTGSLVRFLVVGVFGGVHWKYQHAGEKQHQQRQDDAMDWLGGDHDGKSLLTVLEETK